MNAHKDLHSLEKAFNSLHAALMFSNPSVKDNMIKSALAEIEIAGNDLGLVLLKDKDLCGC